MPTSRSAKDICREHGPESISCSVATKREKRRKKREEEYGEKKPDTSETPKPKEEKTKPPSRWDRKKQLEELEEKYGT